MSTRLISLPVTSVALSGVLALAPAKAADHDFCKAYIDPAIRRVLEASSRGDDVERERDAYTRDLDACAHH